MKASGLTIEQLNSLLALSAQTKSGLVYTALNEWMTQEKRESQRLVKRANDSTGNIDNSQYSNSLPQHMISRLEVARKTARQGDNPQQSSQTRQGITDTFFLLSHLYALSPHNRTLKRDTEQALTQLLMKYPLNIINILQFSDSHKKRELQEQLGLSIEIMALFISYLTPEAIYNSKNSDNLVDNFIRDFNIQIESFKKEGKGELSPEHMVRLIAQVNYLIQLQHRLPDNEAYQEAKIQLNALINSCCRVVPELQQQLGINIPEVSAYFNSDWSSVAGAQRKFVQLNVLKHYDDEIKEVHAEYVRLVNDTVKSLVNSNIGTDYHQSLQNINNQLNQHQLALKNISNTTGWFQDYKANFEKVENLLPKLKAIEKTCQDEYNNLIERQKALEKNYHIELNKIDEYPEKFLDLLADEHKYLENKESELNNTYESARQTIEARKQELQEVIGEIQKNINTLPKIETFQRDVVKKIDATMVSLAGQGGEKDQIFEKVGGDIFNSKASLLEKLETLSKQTVPKNMVHTSKLILENQTKNISNRLNRLQGTGFDEEIRNKFQTLTKGIAKNNTTLSELISSMNAISEKIHHAKQDSIPAGSQLENKDEIPLETLTDKARPKSPHRHAVESNHNLEQLDDHPVFYEKAGALINDRNNEIAQLQRDYDSLKKQHVVLEADNIKLFGELKDIEGDLQDKASSIEALDNKAAELLANGFAERESIRSQELNQLNSSKNDSKQGLIDLVNSKNRFVAAVKKDRALIVDADGKSVSDLPSSLEKDAKKSFDYLESSAEKLVESKIKIAEVCVNRTRQLQNGMEQKQKERDARLSKVPANFKQYCSENPSQTFDQCVVNYGAQLDEIEKEFSQNKTKQRKENREKAITQLKNDFNTITTESKNDIDDINRLDDGRKHVMSELREKSRALDKSTKRTFASFLGGIGGAITGAIIGLIAGPIGVIVGGIIGAGIGGGAGYAAGGIIPTNPPQDSFANTSESSANPIESEDNSAEFEINDLFSGNKIAIVNTENAIMADIPTSKNEKEIDKHISPPNSNNEENEDELSKIKTDEDWDQFILGDNGYKNGKTVEQSNVSKISGTVFHHSTQSENGSKSGVSLGANNSAKNMLKK